MEKDPRSGLGPQEGPQEGPHDGLKQATTNNLKNPELGIKINARNHMSVLAKQIISNCF